MYRHCLAEIVQTYVDEGALVAIDREEINQASFGTARMGAMCRCPFKYYKEECGTAWANYDVDAANVSLTNWAW
jgi:hypothetical protein